MTKGQGYASVGAALLAGLTFRGTLSFDLAWRNPSSPSSSATANQADVHKREQQPSLIILKYDATETGAEPTSFYRLVYLFLVFIAIFPLLRQIAYRTCIAFGPNHSLAIY